MNKWIAISLGTVVGLSHIGMIGMISRQSKFPVVNLPVGPYTSYQVNAGKPVSYTHLTLPTIYSV